MTRLPDPRPAQPQGSPTPLAERLAAVLREPGPRAREVLVRQVRRALSQGSGDDVLALVRDAGPELVGEAVRAVDTAISELDETLDGPESVVARLFLIPIVFVTAGAAPATVQGALPDVNEIRTLLRAAGALGPVETFGLSNALGEADAAWGVSPAALYRLARDFGGAGGVSLLEPAPIELTTADETVHLRFLAGACVTSASAPTFLETAGPVGRWGMSVSKEITEQLATEGLSLLALPRSPMPWYAALNEGRFAREETAFQLFATGAIRRIRSETGDPIARLSTRSDASVRVELTSPFDELSVHAYRWPLAPGDDLARAEASIRDLLHDCRVERVETIEEVQAATALPRAPGGGLFS